MFLSVRYQIAQHITFNLISHQTDIDKIYLYGKDPYKTKHQLLINKRESTGLKHLNDSKAFIEYSDMLSNKKTNPVVTELFIRGRKLNVSLDFITYSYLLYQKILD